MCESRLSFTLCCSFLGFYLFLLCGREEKGLTGVSKRGSDLDGCEVLQERLELQGGELRPPLAAGPLVQSVQKKTEVQTMFQEDDVFSLHCPPSWNLMNLRENRNHFDVFLLIALLIFGLQVTS